MRPDLSDPAARLAYKQELQGIYRIPRRLAVALLVVGVLGLVLSRSSSRGSPIIEFLSWSAIGAGGAAAIFVIVQRTRYHRRRMSG